MADFRAIYTTCAAVVRLLEESYHPDLIEPQLNLRFEVYSTDDFKNHMVAGVSLFLYRVYVNTSQRTPLGKTNNGIARRPQLPLDLHFFLTVWAQQASLQHTILGWAMRTLEDHSVLPASLLNGIRQGVFHDDETVEIVAGQLTNEELMRIWDDLGTEYRLSVPYVARVVRIESLIDVSAEAPVRRREFGYGVVEWDGRSWHSGNHCPPDAAGDALHRHLYARACDDRLACDSDARRRAGEDGHGFHHPFGRPCVARVAGPA